MNIWESLEKKLSEAGEKNAPTEPVKKDDKKQVQPLHFTPHKGSDLEGLEDIISQYVPELIKTGRNAESIRNVLLHFADEVESIVKGN